MRHDPFCAATLANTTYFWPFILKRCFLFCFVVSRQCNFKQAALDEEVLSSSLCCRQRSLLVLLGKLAHFLVVILASHGLRRVLDVPPLQ